MLNVVPQELTQLKLSVQALSEYASRKGWQLISEAEQPLIVFEGPLDDWGNPIRLRLPRHDDYLDQPLRVAEAITLFAAVENRPVQTVIAEIQHLGHQTTIQNSVA